MKAGTPRPVPNVGRKLRDLRKARNLTQSDLAARIGIQQSDLCRMENGQYRVNLETLVKVLREFRISFAEFFQEEGIGTLSPLEKTLLQSFRRLPASKREDILRYARFLDNEPPQEREAGGSDS
jgi:transcriptional regulator with XRE-family HTH domain